MFRKKRQTFSGPPKPTALRAGSVRPPALDVEETAIRLRKADHDFIRQGRPMSFEGYEFFDDSGAFRDPDDVDRALKVGDRLWLARLAGIRHQLSPGHYKDMEPLTVLDLRTDNSNPVDLLAIALHLRDGTRVGYLPASLASDIWNLVKNGHGTALILGVYHLEGRPVGVRLLVVCKNIAVNIELPEDEPIPELEGDRIRRWDPDGNQ